VAVSVSAAEVNFGPTGVVSVLWSSPEAFKECADEGTLVEGTVVHSYLVSGLLGETVLITYHTRYRWLRHHSIHSPDIIRSEPCKHQGSCFRDHADDETLSLLGRAKGRKDRR
jgi:hypothetical protein